jgi:hypothetical protein
MTRDVELDIATRYARALQKALEGAGVPEEQARDCANNAAGVILAFPEEPVYQTIRTRLILQTNYGMPRDATLIALAAIAAAKVERPHVP